MTCPKCGGASVFPAMNEAPAGVRDWRRCLSCGKRWDPTAPVVVSQVAVSALVDEDIDATEQEGTMRKGWSPERRARFMATMAEKRGGVSDRRPMVSGGGKAVPAVVDPETLPTPRSVIGGDVLIALDAAIVSATADVAALERAREILLRGQA